MTAGGGGIGRGDAAGSGGFVDGGGDEGRVALATEGGGDGPGTDPGRTRDGPDSVPTFGCSYATRAGVSNG